LFFVSVGKHYLLIIVKLKKKYLKRSPQTAAVAVNCRRTHFTTHRGGRAKTIEINATAAVYGGTLRKMKLPTGTTYR